MEDRRRVLLSYMPFGLIQIAPLGLSLLKAGLTRTGVDCDIRYFNLDFVDTCLDGTADARAQLYMRLTTRYQLAFSAEAQAASLLFGDDASRTRLIDRHIARADPDERAFLSALPERFEAFVARCVDSVDWTRYRVLGLSSVFLGMTVPSLLLARAVKRRYPHMTTVLGGPNTEGVMGETLARYFPEIDYVLRGEADETWPQLVDAILADRAPGPLPGLVHRDTSGELLAWPMQPIARMDGLPIPDFDDFIAAASRSLLAGRYRARLHLPFESSRGCWWGEKSHCKFCGINGQGMGYRSKSRDRLLAEIDTLMARYHPRLLVATDAILDRAYITTVLPALAERRHQVGFSYEVKANVTRAQMEAMRDAGIAEILPGIETFSTRLLKLMKKGSSAFDNLVCLRLAEECGIKVSWYHMCGLPHETRADYDHEMDTIRRVPHLQPPREIARFTLQRFTPYLQQSEAEGLRNVRPMAEYRAVFPLPADALRDLAYHFEFDFGDGRSETMTAEIEAMLEAAVTDWKRRYGRVTLDVLHDDDGAVMIDTRPAQPIVYLLDGAAARAYAALERAHSALTLARALDDAGAESDRRAAPAAGARVTDTGRFDDAPFDLDWLMGDRGVAASPAWTDAQRLRAALDALLVRVDGPQPESGDDEAARERGCHAWLERLATCDLLYAEDGRYLALAVRRSRAWITDRYAEPALAQAVRA